MEVPNQFRAIRKLIPSRRGRSLIKFGDQSRSALNVIAQPLEKHRSDSKADQKNDVHKQPNHQAEVRSMEKFKSATALFRQSWPCSLIPIAESLRPRFLIMRRIFQRLTALLHCTVKLPQGCPV